jgi:hypothetical protein
MIQIISFSILLLSLYCCNLEAQGIGEVAANIYEPICVIIQLVRAVSVICGAGLLLGGVLRFIEYRRNPVAVRLSMVIFMFLFGASLVIVGLIPMKVIEAAI